MKTQTPNRVLLRPHEQAAIQTSPSVLIARRTWPKCAAQGSRVTNGGHTFTVQCIRRDVPVDSLTDKDYADMQLPVAPDPKHRMHPMFVFGGLWDKPILRQRDRIGDPQKKGALLAQIWQNNPLACLVLLSVSS